MNIKRLKISIEETAGTIDDALVNRLKETAIACAKTAYTPYSHFRVGAAVRLENDVVIGGCNQENAAYSSCLCAERIALTSAHVQYPGKKITHILLCAIKDNALAPTVTPCGECRQVLIEREEAQGQPIHIIIYGSETVYLLDSASELLPLNFGGKDLE